MKSVTKFIASVFANDRVKSFIWRALGMGLAAFLSYIAAHLVDLQLSGTWVVTLGLVIGEITKSLNNWLSQ